MPISRTPEKTPSRNNQRKSMGDHSASLIDLFDDDISSTGNNPQNNNPQNSQETHEETPLLNDPENLQQAQMYTQIQAIQHCKLPPFWKCKPELWFYQAESAFQAHSIENDAQKYHLVISTLDSDSLEEVSDIIAAPPATEKYEYLKTNLIKRFTDSADRQLHQALTELQLGDKKPSQLLRKMRSLVGTKASDDVLRVRWLALLPHHIQNLLKVFKATSLDQLAEGADELMENSLSASVMATGQHFRRSPSPHRSPTIGSTPTCTITQELAELRASMSQLISLNRELLNRLPNSLDGSSRSRSVEKSSPQSRDPSATSSPGESGICYYHRRFADKARKCTLPCAYSGSHNSLPGN